MFLIRVVVSDILLRLSTLFWVAAVVISWVIDSNEQYKANRYILLALLLVHIVLGMFLQYQSGKGRRDWPTSAETMKFKVYHYDLEHNTAEWVQTEASELRPGNIYKIPMGCQSVPTDSVLLHANRRILQVD